MAKIPNRSFVFDQCTGIDNPVAGKSQTGKDGVFYEDASTQDFCKNAPGTNPHFTYGYCYAPPVNYPLEVSLNLPTGETYSTVKPSCFPS